MRTVLFTFLMLAFVPFASAQTRCECEYDDWVNDCDAEFERKGDWILFKSDTQQCSRIDWYTDSQPRLTIVEDGKGTVSLMGIPNDTEISIASCKVCKDALFNQPQENQATAPDLSKSSGNPVSKDRLIEMSASMLASAIRRCGGDATKEKVLQEFQRQNQSYGLGIPYRLNQLEQWTEIQTREWLKKKDQVIANSRPGSDYWPSVNNYNVCVEREIKLRPYE